MPGTIASPTLVDLQSSASSIWPMGDAVRSQRPVLVENLQQSLEGFSYGPYPESPKQALILPINLPGSEYPLGVIVAGVSSRRDLDQPYRLFYDMLRDTVTNAISNAWAYETERQRAEALAEIDRAKTIFFSNVSHEFRTPLTLMLAPTSDALADTDNPLKPIQRQRIELVQRNSMRLLKLVNTLLDFSRIEAGRIQARYEPTDLATFTAELASTFRSLIEQADLALVVDCAPLPEPIYIDREMWEKIVLNLLSNAFKFTFTGSITVRLQPAGDHVELAIADTGIGIPPVEIPHLFERFHRVEGAQGRSFEGSGIGLSLVQELVKLHSGRISVTSTLGQGSCFTLSIPTGRSHLPQDHISVAHPLVSTALGATPYVEEALRWLPQTSSSPWSQKRAEESLANPETCSLLIDVIAHILVVDDNADMLDYIKRLLEQRYSVETAEDGLAALASIEHRRPSLVLADVMMPRMDGFDLLRALRADPQTRELPIVLLSARAGEEARIEGLEAGADDYLIKPFSNRELLARIEACLKMAQIRQESAGREQALRLLAEQAQRDAETMAAQLNHILESMSDGFIALDKAGQVMYQNAAAAQLSNFNLHRYELGNTQGDEWLDSVDSEQADQYRYAMTAHVSAHFEHRYENLPQPDVWIETHAYPFQEGLGIFFRDISDRKQAEISLRQAKEELEDRVAERTTELRQIIAELQQAEDTIKASLREKEVLLQEVHHRVKNNLSIVSSLLQMQARRAQSPQASRILRDSQNRIGSIALVHEKLYSSKDLANINLAQYLQDLIVYLFESYNIRSKRITLDTQIEDLSLDIETAIPCGLIVNELVSNALKYAFPDDRTGVVQVSLTHSPNSSPDSQPPRPLTLIVRDNGIGLPPDFNLKQTKTLGISLVQGLVQQIKGTLEVSCQQGTEFKVQFTISDL